MQVGKIILESILASYLDLKVMIYDSFTPVIHPWVRNGRNLNKYYNNNRLIVVCLYSLLDSKEIKPVNTKGNQPWIFIGRTDAEAEAPILWSPEVKSHLIGKEPVTGKDLRQEKKGETEDEMVGWHHWLNRHEFEQTPGDSEGHGSLACCSQWGCKDLDTSEQ